MSDYYSSWEREYCSNKHIDRWNELEEFAREMYELETWLKVYEVWFVEYDEFVGVSPDWMIWDNWLIEIKCQDDKKHFKMLLDWKIDSKYIRQMQMQLLVTGREWCDFVSYNPNYEKSLIIVKIEPSKEMFEDLQKWFKKWKEMILTIKTKLE